MAESVICQTVHHIIKKEVYIEFWNTSYYTKKNPTHQHSYNMTESVDDYCKNNKNVIIFIELYICINLKKINYIEIN